MVHPLDSSCMLQRAWQTSLVPHPVNTVEMLEHGHIRCMKENRQLLFIRRTRGCTEVAIAELDSSDAFTACARSHLTSAKNLANMIGDHKAYTSNSVRLERIFDATDRHVAIAQRPAPAIQYKIC